MNGGIKNEKKDNWHNSFSLDFLSRNGPLTALAASYLPASFTIRMKSLRQL